MVDVIANNLSEAFPNLQNAIKEGLSGLSEHQSLYFPASETYLSIFLY